MFRELTGDTAVVRKGGVYRTCPLYEWRGVLFAKFGAGFVRLHADGRASLDGLFLGQLAYEGPLFKDRFGRLTVEKGDGYEALTANPDGTLIPLALEAPT